MDGDEFDGRAKPPNKRLLSGRRRGSAVPAAQDDGMTPAGPDPCSVSKDDMVLEVAVAAQLQLQRDPDVETEKGDELDGQATPSKRLRRSARRGR